MSKYPGSFIINEVGTVGDLATVYGVSERTIYRWLNKATKESGIRPHKKHKTPRPSTLVNFKGTRKQLAKKYGVSESTVYWWIKHAKAGGTDIPSRRQGSKYPGDETIINLLTNTPMTTKEMAEKFGVSTRTIGRWIRQTKLNRGSLIPDKRKTGEYKLRRKKVNGVWISWYEKVEEPEPEQLTFEDYIEDAYNPENITEPPEYEEPEPVYEEPIEGSEDFYEVEDAQEYTGNNPVISGDYAQDLGIITALLYDNDLLYPNSLFNDLDYNEKIEMIHKYLEKRTDEDPELFYNKETGEYMDTSPEFVATINIWGNSFEKFLIEQRETDLYEI